MLLLRSMVFFTKLRKNSELGNYFMDKDNGDTAY